MPLIWGRRQVIFCKSEAGVRGERPEQIEAAHEFGVYARTIFLSCATEKALSRWIAEHRLSSTGFPDTGAASSPEGIRILERLREARPRATANLARLVAELDRPT
jgi:hypothetical protein